MDYSQLEDSFYRVSVKVLIQDELGRLLVCKNDKGLYEIPGGGWDFDETLEHCARRELEEELHAKLSRVSDVEFVLRGHNSHGYQAVRLVVRAVLESDELVPDDDIVSFEYVNRNDFVQLEFALDDEEFPGATDRIWSE